MQRYYIEKLDDGDYPVDEIVYHLKLTKGVKRISSANKFYWHNLPRVITFSCDDPSTTWVIETWLPENLKVRTHWAAK